MKELSLDDLKLALSECAALSGETEFVVVGSLAIVGAHPLAPANLRVSQDIDLFFLKGATLDRNRAIYERFGPDSEFAELHDFYIEPVGDWTVMTSLPGWRDRLVPVAARHRLQQSRSGTRKGHRVSRGVVSQRHRAPFGNQSGDGCDQHPGGDCGACK